MPDRIKLMQVPRDRPLYTAVRDKILDLITQGTYPPGSQLPPETELTHLLGVSRVILREALRTLEEDNLLLRRHGVGTFVNRPIPLSRSDLHVNYGVTEIIELNGFQAGTSDQLVERCAADDLVAEKLRLNPGDQVIRIQRVRTADGCPVAFTVDFVPESLLDVKLVDRLQGGSLYQLLEEQGRFVKAGWARIAPVKAGYRIAEKLGINPDSVTLMIEQVDYGLDDCPLVYSREYHLRQAFEFTVYRVRSKESGGQCIPRGNLLKRHLKNPLQPASADTFSAPDWGGEHFPDRF